MATLLQSSALPSSRLQPECLTATKVHSKVTLKYTRHAHVRARVCIGRKALVKKSEDRGVGRGAGGGGNCVEREIHSSRDNLSERKKEALQMSTCQADVVILDLQVFQSGKK